MLLAVVAVLAAQAVALRSHTKGNLLQRNNDNRALRPRQDHSWTVAGVTNDICTANPNVSNCNATFTPQVQQVVTAYCNAPNNNAPCDQYA